MPFYGKTTEQKIRNSKHRNTLKNVIKRISKLKNGHIRTLSREKTIEYLVKADQPIKNDDNLPTLKQQLRDLKARKSNFLSNISEENESKNNEKESEPIAKRVGTRKDRQYWKETPSPFSSRERFISEWDSGDIKEKFSFGRKAEDKWGKMAYTKQLPNRISEVPHALRLLSDNTLIQKCTGNPANPSRGYWVGSHNPRLRGVQCCSLFKNGYVAHARDGGHDSPCGWGWTGSVTRIGNPQDDLFGGGRRRTRKLRR
jgi:hypothetical protein